MLDLSIIIVSFNTKEFLKSCLESIKSVINSNLTYEIIVVDNNSTDGSIEEVLSSKYKVLSIRLIKNNQNVGFAKANNIGIREAKGKYLLFLNSDTKITYEHTFDEMVAFMDHHANAGAATCIVQLEDGTLDDASHRGFPTPWNALCHFSGLGKFFPKSNFFNGYHKGWKDLDRVHEIDSLAGAFMIVRREAGEQIGWWDEDYFFYGEDIDFCYNLKQKNWKIYYVPTVKILHYKGVSSGIKDHSKHLARIDSAARVINQKARFDAMRIFYKKHYIDKYPGYVTDLILIGINLKEWLTNKKK